MTKKVFLKNSMFCRYIPNIDLYIKRAKQKLKRIILREGDLNGARRDPEYLNQLIIEELRLDKFTEFCCNSSKEIFTKNSDFFGG